MNLPIGTGKTGKTQGVMSAIANGKVAKPTVRIQTITPKQADQILSEQNMHNRSLRESRVTHLAGNLARDEWRLTGSAIVFDLDGVLLDGQHRLAACVAADKPIEVIVLRNVPRENQDVMDDTLARRLGDALMLRGEGDVHRLGAGINWYARLVYAEITGRVHYANNAMRPSIPQLLEVYRENPGLRDALNNTRAVNQQLKLRSGPVIAVYYRLSRVDAQHTEAFFEQFRTGANLPEESPILALRRFSENERDRARRKSNPDFMWPAVALKAWNYWREGRSIQVLKFLYGPLNSEQWPEPV
jgi:hypothetical protein